MVLKFGRRLSLKNVFCLFIFLITMVVFYFLNSSNKRYDMSKWEEPSEDRNSIAAEFLKNDHATIQKPKYSSGEMICRPLASSVAKIDTFEVFQRFNFQPSWLRSREYWDSRFEEAYQKSRNVRHSYPLKVILMLHSHNDPGWLLKFEDYFNRDSKTILSNAVSKLTEHKNLTFIWSEMAFLSRWWDERHSDERQMLKKLVKEGRFEITTGGWVMNDEATSTYFAMIDQLIEGHQWVKNNLGVSPKYGWSIDPFGHGSTLPFLLAESDIKGSVIQRIHYSWKQALAENKSGDFYWLPNWKSGTKMLIHNQPYDIYSIKHSCGPHPQICLNFDFRSVFGEYSESTAQNITHLNVQHFSELLLEQFQKTASLYPHNVVLMPIGDDFRYKNINEFDQQYINYQKIANYINSHSRFYNNTEFQFGTLSTYFDAVAKRMNSNFPSLKGDFFPYSDIFSEGRPAYWTGFYTTRPFYKILCRELENNLRTSEILFTIALNRIQQNKSENLTRRFESLFAKLTVARRYLALFQHHDAITGTSKQAVMEDYGLKLTEAIRVSQTVQESSIQSLLYPQLVNVPNLISTLSDRKYSDNLPRKIPIHLTGFVNEQKSLIIFNPLGQQAQHLVQFHILMLNTQNVHLLKNLEILDAANQEIDFQITPVVKHFPNNLSDSEFEVSFISNLTALTINTYYIKITATENSRFATIICDKRDRDCSKNAQTTTLFNRESVDFVNDVILENDVLEATFDARSGLLSAVRHDDFGSRRSPIACKLTFGTYVSAQSHSGAYLFMRDPNFSEKSKDILEDLKSKRTLRVVKGRIYSELHVQYDTLLVHKVRLYQQPNSPLLNGLYIENEIDYGTAPNYRDQEMFMRITSDVQNGVPPISYTDVNGLHMQKRIKVPALDLEGNYWPITNLIFIQDSKMRLNLLTDHAQGASAFEPGSLEVMVDRRTLYDDGRGLNEGVTDNRKTLQRHWIVVEKIADKTRPTKANAAVSGYEYEDEPLRSFNVVDDQTNNRYVSMSGHVQYLLHLLNYRPNPFVSNNNTLTNNQNTFMKMVKDELPCDVHLVNLRTRNHPVFDQDPSPSAFLTLFRNYFDCSITPNSNSLLRSCFQTELVDFDLVYAIPDTIQAVSLTGLHTVQKLKHFSDLLLSPMQIKTLNVTFVN